jgi:nucleotide-binding universal stress UspA family protein
VSKNRTDVIIRKILVAVDGSKASLDAAEEAIDLAEIKLWVVLLNLSITHIS